MNKVSIVTPVYNGELYIVDCLSSIARQSYKNIELIIVNDGSTDSTTEKIECFIANCSYPIEIKHVIKENGGVSSARNKGVQLATGNFIVFVDADDTVSPEHVSSLLAPLKECESSVLVCNRLVDKHRRVKNIEIKGLYHSEDFERGYSTLESSNQLGYLHNKIFFKDIVMKNNILFNEKISMAEDLLFVLQYIGFVDGFYFSSVSSYKYNRNEGSLSEIKKSDDEMLYYLEILKSTYRDLSMKTIHRKGMSKSIDFFYGLKKTTALMSVYVYRVIKNTGDIIKVKNEINGSLSFDQIFSLKKINTIKYLVLILPHFFAQKLIKNLYKKKY